MWSICPLQSLVILAIRVERRQSLAVQLDGVFLIAVRDPGGGFGRQAGRGNQSAEGDRVRCRFRSFVPFLLLAIKTAIFSSVSAIIGTFPISDPQIEQALVIDLRIIVLLLPEQRIGEAVEGGQ